MGFKKLSNIDKYKYKGYALDCSGYVYGKLYKDNPRFKKMIYNGNEYIAVNPETVEKI